MSEVAKRYNAGKVDFTLLPVDALEAEAAVWGVGEVKYGRNNWEKLWGDETMKVCLQSALRHTYAMLNGEMLDPESGQPHAAHVRCNMAMIIRYLKTQPQQSPVPTVWEPGTLPQPIDPTVYAGRLRYVEDRLEDPCPLLDGTYWLPTRK